VDRLNMAESRLGSSGTLRSGQNASSMGVAHDTASFGGGMSMVMQGQGQMETAQRRDQEGLVAEIEELQRERGAMLASIAQKEAQRDEAIKDKDDAMRGRDAAERERDSAVRERDGALGRLGHAEYEARELRKSYEGLKAIGSDPKNPTSSCPGTEIAHTTGLPFQNLDSLHQIPIPEPPRNHISDSRLFALKSFQIQGGRAGSQGGACDLDETRSATYKGPGACAGVRRLAPCRGPMRLLGIAYFQNWSWGGPKIETGRGGGGVQGGQSLEGPSEEDCRGETLYWFTLGRVCALDYLKHPGLCPRARFKSLLVPKVVYPQKNLLMDRVMLGEEG